MFLLFLLFTLAFYILLAAPKSTHESYAPVENDRKTYFTYTITDDKEIMNTVLANLKRIQSSGQVLKYGLIINKTENISSSEKEAIEKEIADTEDIIDKSNKEEIIKSEAVNKVLQIGEQVDSLLGGSTLLSQKNRSFLLTSRESYKESSRIWEMILYKDKFTNAAGRLFADYMGIAAGFLPAFLAAFYLRRESASQMHEIIYNKNISSFKYIASKFLALFTLLSLVFILLASCSTIMYYYICKYNNYTFEVLSFFKYTAFWILPTVLFTISFSLFIVTVFERPLVAVALQLILWLISVLPKPGEYGLYRIFIRFNSLGGYESYIKYFYNIAVNRVFYMFISCILLAFSVYIFDRKRGNISGGLKVLLSNNQI
jgi:hypothetical protein